MLKALESDAFTFYIYYVYGTARFPWQITRDGRRYARNGDSYQF